MKRYLLFAAGIAILFGFATSWQPLKAQVYGDFDTIRIETAMPYQELDPAVDIPIPAAQWGLPPNWITDYDDGYSFPTGVDIGFPFEFNGEVYTKVWICVNGFITFTPPPFIPAKVPTALFIESVSYPRNVAAPFWGDHVYRLQNERLAGFAPTRISYFYDDVNGIFTVQWKDLNINSHTDQNSIANFQVKLYKSNDPYSFAGNVEFAYGQVGGNPYTTQTLVITRNSAVGLKGETGDYLNGLTYGQDPYISRTKTDLTNNWPPSNGATDNRILFTALGRINIEEFWGDGDVDFSKRRGGRNENMPQSRFVTVNDARLIMKAVATAIPLDSVRRRQAYHGDVNHNGRYWYDNNGVRQDIYWRDQNYANNLPQGVSSLKRVFFQANEYDAAMILQYIAARIPELPWLLDTVPQYGRIAADTKANNILFGTPRQLNQNSYEVPVYLNGYIKGPMAFKFDVNGTVTDAQGIFYSQNNVFVDHGQKTVVVSATGEFDASSPVCTITVQTDNPQLSASDIRFNDVKVSDSKIALSVNDYTNIDNSTLKAEPNVMTNGKSIITFNAPATGFYDLAIYDEIGNKVKTLAVGSLDKRSYTFEWSGANDNGNQLQSGVYFLRLSGSNVSLSQKLLLSR